MQKAFQSVQWQGCDKKYVLLFCAEALAARDMAAVKKKNFMTGRIWLE